MDHSTITVFNHFVRYRNVLMSEADFGPLFRAYDEHLATNHLELPDDVVQLFKGCLAACTLHCASRPRNEVIGWTINFQDPLLNVFLGGDTELGSIAGRVFLENIKASPMNSFHQELAVRGKPLRKSFVEFEGHDPMLAAEAFYERSEQRPARFFQMDSSRYIMLSAHPDWDREWFHGIDQEGMKTIETDQTLSLLEKRDYGWHCGCSQDKIMKVLLPIYQNDADGLYQGDPSVTVNCPRCCAKYAISREAIEAFAADEANRDTDSA
ncbi:MAG: Hsp33 family molecular chaperone HslO [Opitutales bacterium]